MLDHRENRVKQREAEEENMMLKGKGGYRFVDMLREEWRTRKWYLYRYKLMYGGSPICLRGLPGSWYVESGFSYFVPSRRKEKIKRQRDERCQDYKWRSFQPPTHSRSPMSSWRGMGAGCRRQSLLRLQGSESLVLDLDQMSAFSGWLPVPQ